MREMRGALESQATARDALAAMTEESLAALFNASRDTCRKAREAVLSEIVGN